MKSLCRGSSGFSPHSSRVQRRPRRLSGDGRALGRSGGGAAAAGDTARCRAHAPATRTMPHTRMRSQTWRRRLLRCCPPAPTCARTCCSRPTWSARCARAASRDASCGARAVRSQGCHESLRVVYCHMCRRDLCLSCSQTSHVAPLMAKCVCAHARVPAVGLGAAASGGAQAQARGALSQGVVPL